ncbi:MAG: hypothetical protein JO001_19365 [Alphaproteobacteria bacterium]|nr:hypothetical protein [Alphaproteobacteria bacterium]
MKYPDAEPGELELENIGSYGQDSRSGFNSEQSHTLEFEYGVNNFWLPELEFEFDRDPGPGNKTNFSQITLENVFQLTERGEYWIDAGFFAEFGKSMTGGTPNETTLGPIFRKEIAGTINTVNLFLEKDIGNHSGGHPNFVYAWETRLALGTVIEPGIQVYGEPGPVGRFLPISQQDHRIGPQLFGNWHDIGPGTLHFNAGVLFGLTPGSPRRTLRWQAEYELHF